MKTTLAAMALLILGSPALAQTQEQVDRINRNFDALKGDYKMQTPGTIQKTTAPIQKPGEFQKPKEWEIPKGAKAINQWKMGDCQERLSVSSDTLFKFNEATLTPFAEEALKLLGPKLANFAGHPIKIEGHTDSVGDDAYNMGLSRARAERVSNWLLSNRFIDPRCVTIEAVGETNPVAPNTLPDGKDNPKGRALNRRVELVVDTCKKVDATSKSTSTSAPTPTPTPAADLPTAQ